ncbi:hypothetical protein QT327_21255 [Olivibacter sp. 47]|uniref:hypothetical protein n=1 Tax=Olivibacter sp. 47 TaxID=3056486 RepID=UPI0025A38B97|nr:hypothetical protein [Olivibacter sp. 47]MDM8176844.1 hypothetical protein [Olivibacter sp. 47]
MDAKNIEKLAADSLLNRGVRYNMPAPKFLRLLFIKHIPITLRRPYYGISTHISRLYVSTGIDPETTKELTRHKIFELHHSHGKTFSKIIAYAVLNSFFLTWLVRPLAWFFRAFCHEEEFVTMLYIILALSAKKDFVDIIGLAAGMVVTSPANETSQENEGS